MYTGLKSRKFIICIVILVGTFVLIAINKLSAETGATIITSVLGIYSAFNNLDKNKMGD